MDSNYTFDIIMSIPKSTFLYIFRRGRSVGLPLSIDYILYVSPFSIANPPISLIFTIWVTYARSPDQILLVDSPYLCFGLIPGSVQHRTGMAYSSVS